MTWVLGAIAAFLLLALILAHIPSGTGSSGASYSTPQQVAHALIGTGSQNLSTGQDEHDTIMAATPDSSFTPAPGGGRQFRCDITLSSGRTLTAEVTLWGNGTIGWHQVTS